MVQDKLALRTDGSGFARGLETEFVEKGWTVLAFEGSPELAGLLDDRCAAVIIVNPHLRLAKAARAEMRRAGGRTSRVPMIAALSDRGAAAETDVLRCFDDFVMKPTGAAEIEARIAVDRARRGGEGEVIVSGELAINLDAHQVHCSGLPVDLTLKEYELLKELASRKGKVQSRQELLRNIWGYDYYGGTRTVDVHVRRLRAKLEGSGRYIETVRGVGYRFTCE